jgi:ferritin
MASKKIIDALNRQINEEIYSAYLYLSMEAYFQSKNLDGFANWMSVQVLEEQVHAKKFYDFIHERGGRVVLEAIKKPDFDWASPLAAFKAAYEHERHISECINNLVDLVIKEKDHASNNFLQWFVSEQVEEESTADKIVQQLTMLGDHQGGLFMLNRELAQRVFTPPPVSK